MTQIKPEEAEEILGDPVTDNEQKPKSELLEKIDVLHRWLKSDVETARSAFENTFSYVESEKILDELLDQVQAAISGPLAELREVAAKAVPAVPEQFKEWFLREVPEGTIIGNPEWWADRIAKRFMSAPAPMVPEGWKLVPIEPTAPMLKAAFRIDISNMLGQEAADRRAIYRAMLAASPEVKS